MKRELGSTPVHSCPTCGSEASPVTLRDGALSYRCTSCHPHAAAFQREVGTVVLSDQELIVEEPSEAPDGGLEDGFSEDVETESVDLDE